jgi:ATP-dependent RNA helicase RhlE
LSFKNLGLIEPLSRAVREEGYIHPTPIQEEAIGLLLDGADLLGCAQTGTGKTAAFALPILQRLAGGKAPAEAKRPVRALVVTPTRELAAQIGESFATYGRHTHLRYVTVHGGVRQGPQVRKLKRGVDVLVATPGRLLDLMGQKVVTLAKVEVLVLDEADRMLDMGFIPDIRKIVARVPERRQTMLFSATMPKSIMHLANSILTDPVEIRITPEAPAAETVDQTVYFVEPRHKQALLHHLLDQGDISRALVFARTKRGADRIVLHLKHAHYSAEVIHSDKPQRTRQRVLNNFKEGKTRVLVASDIAARGLDVDDISHVINYDLPKDPEMYVHRIGRTGRAGQPGRALSFCGLAERDHLDGIERLIDQQVPTAEDYPFASPIPRGPRKTPEAKIAAGWRRFGRKHRRRLRRR